MSSPSQKPLKRSKLTIQSPVAAELQPPVVLRPGKRDSDSPLQSSKQKNAVTEIKKNLNGLKILVPTMKPKFDLNQTKVFVREDESLITQAKRSFKQISNDLVIDTSQHSSKSIGAVFFSTCDSPEIREV
jgi:lipid A disaccharide synthetase